ncbi:MAG TPA: response regulator transcription factor [Burkholderiales bacterium]|jgi:two-component system, NarL family, invasion response regulator UvrY|nr:response regulator transcription factor [Burkholderiales bacterium]
MIRVLVADDHAVVRKGLVQILSDTESIRVVGEAPNAAEAMRQLRQTPCDVLLMDVSMPGKNGIEALKFLKEEFPQLKVLILSMYPEDQFGVRALKAGAAGYLTKDIAPEKLIEAVERIMSGKRFITPELAELLAESMGPSSEVAPHHTLSDREFQTLRLIASGKKLSEIAETLSLSPKTVSVYRTRLLEKMRLSNNAELTHYAIKHGLVE